jgi:hypothetical protein
MLFIATVVAVLAVLSVSACRALASQVLYEVE